MVASGDFAELEKISGCDLMTEAPEIASWLSSVVPGKHLTIGNYTYLDGALHVQIAVACDAIMQQVCKERKDTAVAFLGTPTDAHVVTKEAVAMSNDLYVRASPWMRCFEALGILKRNNAACVGDLHYMDAIVNDQGPNYILAKRLQHWRAMVARADGHTASSNVSPSTATASVTSNANFAAAYGGMHIFRPMEVAQAGLSLSVMGALLVHDLRNPKSAAHPSTKLEHPLCLFQATSFHGGVWRIPYTISSIGLPSALAYYLMEYWAFTVAFLAAFLTGGQYLVTGSLPQVPILRVVEDVVMAFYPAIEGLAKVFGIPG
jgi:hypothetical protein